MIENNLLKLKIKDLFEKYPEFSIYFEVNNFPIIEKDIDKTLLWLLSSKNELFYSEKTISKKKFINNTLKYLDIILKEKETIEIKKITLIWWLDKSWNKEIIENFNFFPWDIISIVWPTWSWKSKLLNDLEKLSDWDSKNKRIIKINDKIVDRVKYESVSNLIAHISQNMNFLTNMSIKDFLKILILWKNMDSNIIETTIEKANLLCWEAFMENSFLTNLSWWQSRALMISIVLEISTSKVVLIDEIENAWIDKIISLELLKKWNKIIFISTHNPIIALLGDKRIVMKNGWINKIIETTKKEKIILEKLLNLDKFNEEIKNNLKKWELLTWNIYQ